LQYVTHIFHMQPKTLFIGQKIIELDVVDSTNNYAANLLSQTNVVEGTVIMAHYQVSGRGQMGNEWLTEPGQNLTCTVVLQPRFIQANTSFILSMAVALAVRNTLVELLKREDIQIKWPNDILAEKLKIAGILIENQWQRQQLTSIIGIGLNVNQLFSTTQLRATSCRMLNGKEFTISDVLALLCQHLEKMYLQLSRLDWETITLNYYENLLYYRQSRPFRVKDEIIQAMLIGIAEDGKLILQLITGETRYFGNKEVEFIL
jgi:BirA family transcriptional regulator, biotin operon repressor / biotin---[acetyl-CoA-carboxylase] ligase